jgi:GAF domain-containing protein
MTTATGARPVLDLTCGRQRRQIALCDDTIGQADVMVIEDATRDPRFEENPLVTGESNMRFYAGALLMRAPGRALGSLCTINRVQWTLDAVQCKQLVDLGAIFMSQINLQCAAGRVDEATHLPNHAQVSEDLTNLARLFLDQPCVLRLVEAMDHGAIRDAVRAVSIPP